MVSPDKLITPITIGPKPESESRTMSIIHLGGHSVQALPLDSPQQIIQSKAKEVLSLREERVELTQFKAKLPLLKEQIGLEKNDDKDTIQATINATTKRVNDYSSNWIKAWIYSTEIGEEKKKIKELELAKLNLSALQESEKWIECRSKTIDFLDRYQKDSSQNTIKNLEVDLTGMLKKERLDLSYLLQKIPKEHHSVVYAAVGSLRTERQKAILAELKKEATPSVWQNFVENLLKTIIHQHLSHPDHSPYHGALESTVVNCMEFNHAFTVQSLLDLIPQMKPKNKVYVSRALIRLPSSLQSEAAKKIVEANSPLATEILKGILKEEIDHQVDAGSLFKTDSLYTRMCTLLMQKEMGVYAKTVLSPLLAEIVREGEIDPKKIMNLLNTGLTKTPFPTIIKKILSEHYEQVSEKFGHAVAIKNVLATFALRFINPFLTDPEKLQLAPYRSEQSKRAVKIAKMIQDVVNQTEPGFLKQADKMIGKLAVAKALSTGQQESLSEELIKYFDLGTSNFLNPEIVKAFNALNPDKKNELTGRFSQARQLTQYGDFILASSAVFQKPIRPSSNETAVALIKDVLQGKGAKDRSSASFTTSPNKPPIDLDKQFVKDFTRQTYLERGNVLADGAGLSQKKIQIDKQIQILKEKAAKQGNQTSQGELENQLRISYETLNFQLDLAGIAASNHLNRIRENYGDQVLKNVALVFLQTTSSDISINFSNQFRNGDGRELVSTVHSQKYDFYKDEKGNFHLKIISEYHVKDQVEASLVGRIETTRDIIIPDGEMRLNWETSSPPHSALQVVDFYKVLE